jgi:uncharacterized protein with PQ loop repeat
MNLDNISQFGVSIAFIFITADLISQILKIYKAKTSKEISLIGLGIRIVGTSFFLFRFIVINDTVFLIGQSIFVALLLGYIGLVVKYRKNS